MNSFWGSVGRKYTSGSTCARFFNVCTFLAMAASFIRSLLDDDGEDGVRPRRVFVHLRPARGARHATELEEAEHLVRVRRDNLARAGHDDGAVAFFAYAYAFWVGVRMQQVTHLLVVHFQERASNAHVAGS